MKSLGTMFVNLYVVARLLRDVHVFTATSNCYYEVGFDRIICLVHDVSSSPTMDCRRSKSSCL